MRHIGIAALAASLTLGALTACTSPPDPAEAASLLASELATGEIATVSISQIPDLEAIYGDLADAERTVTVPEVTVDEEDSDSATIQLEWKWDVDGREWAYTTSAAALLDDGSWTVQWDPSIVHPAAAADSSFVISRTGLPERAEIVSDTSGPLVTLRPVFRIGVDKTFVTDEQAQRDAALELATALGFDDPEGYAASVAASGERAFVEAITIRQEDAEEWNVEELRAIVGVNVVIDERQLAPSAAFARPVLGRVGDATAEIVDASEGRIAAGDVVGVSGLSKLYDEQLGGSPGLTVHLTIGEDRQLVFEAPPVEGEPLTVTLSITTQELAEEVLSDSEGVSSLVAIQPSTGNVLAAATTDSWNASSLGQYAAGSTFKVVSALALLRSGYTPESLVECPESVEVDGKQFTNHPGYSRTGTITLREAFAHSCNTVFIGFADQIPPEDVASAALSLGIGQPGPWPFEYFSGDVPTDVTATTHAASLIGQGEVLVSPLAMATVAASVAAGQTVTPVLVGNNAPELDSSTVPLTESETAALADMMAAVVSSGNSTSLAHIDGLHAKTGTAEVGEGDEAGTNAWMIAYRGDLSVAVLVEGGRGGIQVAGPVIEAFFVAHP